MTLQIFAQNAVAFLLLLAAIMQFAVWRDDANPNYRGLGHFRMLKTIGYFGLAVRLAYLTTDHQAVTVSPIALMFMGVLAVGSIGMAIDKLTVVGSIPAWGDRRRHIVPVEGERRDTDWSDL